MPHTYLKEAQQEYHSITQHWLNFHYGILVICVAISIMFEIVMFLLIRFTGELYDGAYLYWLKFILAPACIDIVIMSIAGIILHQKRLSYQVKSYSLSILFLLAAFTLCFMHSGFISVLYVVCIPILMTSLYENQRLTFGIFIAGIALQLFCAFTSLWDPYKDFKYQYKMDLLVVLVVTSMIYLISHLMIRFALMKKQIIIQHDVQRHQLKVKVQEDELTMVGNKSALMKELAILVNQQTPFYVAMMDIDDFKQINDQCGHLFGDEVLKSLGGCLKALNNHAKSYRYGGDEFCVIFLEERQHVVEALIQDLQTSFAYTCAHMKDGFAIGISAGLAKSEKEMDVKTLLKKADDALYEAKRKRKAQNETAFHS